MKCLSFMCEGDLADSPLGKWRLWIFSVCFIRECPHGRMPYHYSHGLESRSSLSFIPFMYQLVRLPSSLHSAPKWSKSLSPAIIITSISPCLGSLSSFSALLSISQNHLTHYPLKICHISPGSFYPCDEGPTVTSLRKPKLDLVMALPASCQPDLRSDPSRHPALRLPPNQCLVVESGSARGRRAWRFPSFTGAQWSCFGQARRSSFPVSS